MQQYQHTSIRVCLGITTKKERETIDFSRFPASQGFMPATGIEPVFGMKNADRKGVLRASDS